jgi:hypothetical protein
VAVVDAYASTPWYLDHIRPIMAALGEHAGRVFVAGEQAQMRGTNPILTVAYGDYVTARRIGRTRLILGQHGAGQSYLKDGIPLPAPSYPGGKGQEGVGLFLTPNETAARWTRYRYPKANIAVVGCPKLDTLPERIPDDRQTIALSTHWAGTVAPEAGSAWPTFKNALLRLARDYHVIGHSHPRQFRTFEAIYRAAGIEPVAMFSRVCELADLYVCDNSSSLFEFASTNRPVVVLNAPQYRRHVVHGLRFWPAASVGIQVDSPEQLAGAVARALERRPEDIAARDAALSLVYQPLRGGATMAAAAILDWVGR